MTRARGVAVLGACAAFLALVQPCDAASIIEITYSIATRGDVHADVAAFESAVADAYADPRGWSLGGAVRFRRVASGGDFILWLASPDQMTTFAQGCLPQWS